jgi:hypothetical protein
MRHFAFVLLILLGVVGSSIAGVVIHLRNNTDIVLDGVQVIYEGKQRLLYKFRVTEVFFILFLHQEATRWTFSPLLLPEN